MPIMPMNPNAAGSSVGKLPGSYEYKVNSTSGGLELWKGTELVATQNSDGSWFKTSVSTGVGSLHLGGGDSSDPAHSISSAGQNVVFKNEAFSATPEDGVVWFPAGWQGLTANLDVLLTPTYLQFSDKDAAYQPNGNATTGGVLYDFATTIASNFVVSSVQVRLDESYTGKLKNIIKSQAKGIELHATVVSINAMAGSIITINYPSLFFARSGDSLILQILKEDGSPLRVRRGTTNTSLPWRNLTIRPFTDMLVGNVHIGDVKEAYRTTDHNGWILMDGRSISLLTATQQASCATLGIAGTLPDARNRMSVGAGNLYGRGNTGGALKLARSALPNVGITGTTLGGSAHTHGTGSFALVDAPDHTHPAIQQYSYNYSRLDGGDDSTGTWAFPTFATINTQGGGRHGHAFTGSLATESSHTHQFTTDSMNGNVSQTDHLPPYIAFGKFIYLGL